MTGLFIMVGALIESGGNAAAIGASANVIVLGIAERNGQPTSFWQFTGYGGVIVATATVLISAAHIWLR